MSEQFDLFAEPDPVAESKPKKQQEIKPKTEKKKPRVVYFDLETQKGADDVGGWGNSHLMKLSVGVVWDSLEEKYISYWEKDAEKLVEKLKSADLVVGFNVIGFDYSVLQPYSKVDLNEINTFDMLVDVKKRLGFRLSLNHLAQESFGAEKSADGLLALKWFKEGKMNLIEEYCIKDVEITRDLFLFGKENGYVKYKSKGKGVQELKVDWSA
jgi:DEAD/DEAH box helicase domain-containing protein